MIRGVIYPLPISSAWEDQYPLITLFRSGRRRLVYSTNVFKHGMSLPERKRGSLAVWASKTCRTEKRTPSELLYSAFTETISKVQRSYMGVNSGLIDKVHWSVYTCKISLFMWYISIDLSASSRRIEILITLEFSGEFLLINQCVW